ncbi:MAG: erythromycin esterase family protein [Firmicutes bacterium]|nr:erythromycin esterase family protein [Bacillota bacterium]
MRKILIILILTLTVSGCSSAAGNYLKENKSTLDMNSPDLELLTPDLADTEIILAGEYHAVAGNFTAKYGLMTTLHKEAGIRYLLCEMGHGIAGLLNQYMETGKAETLDFIFEELKGSGAWSIEHREFWERLREYNLQQPKDERIIVIGIDVEHQFRAALYYLTTLNGADELPLLQDIKLQDWDDFTNFVFELQKERANKPEKYSDALAEDLFYFDDVVENLVNRIAVAEADQQAMYIREQAMYENFLKFHEHLPAGKYFGQFGMAHVFQEQCASDMEGVERLAMYLQRDDSPVRDQVISIAYIYINSKMSSWQNDYRELAVQDQFTDTRPVERQASADFTLFKLNSAESPYAEEPLLIPGPYRGVTTDYFQYVLAIKNSPATTPYGPWE